MRTNYHFLDFTIGESQRYVWKPVKERKKEERKKERRKKEERKKERNVIATFYTTILTL